MNSTLMILIELKAHAHDFMVHLARPAHLFKHVPLCYEYDRSGDFTTSTFVVSTEFFAVENMC